MADNGKLYPIFNMEYVDAMRVLCGEADILVPNITEACFLTGEEYKETYDESYIRALVEKLTALGAKTVVLTGVSYEPKTTGVVVYENGKMDYYKHGKMAKGSHGTGDIYASAFVGALMNDKSVYEAAKIAADYTVKCIMNTQGDADHWYGAKFEPVLRELIDMLG
jgi:pyridoxine kinase